MVSPATDARHPAQAWSGSGQLERPARRIASLLPSATEIVCALGLADRLVAVTHECDHPAAELKDVPRITSNLLPPELRRSDEIDAAVRSAVTTGHGLYALDASEMARLEPDLVLTQELCQVCAIRERSGWPPPRHAEDQRFSQLAPRRSEDRPPPPRIVHQKADAVAGCNLPRPRARSSSGRLIDCVWRVVA